MVATLGDYAPAPAKESMNSRGVGRALEMTQGPDVVPQPLPKKTLTVSPHGDEGPTFNCQSDR